MKKKRPKRLKNLNIRFLALTGNPAHGEPVSILKSMNAEPAVKGEIFQDEDKEELDILEQEGSAEIESQNLRLEIADIAENLEAGTIKTEDAITRLREITENGESSEEARELSYDELKQTLNL